MKFKFSTISISLLLAGLLVYGFISLNSNDPYTDYAPEVETSILPSNGIELDTVTPAGWPFPVVWNFYYGNIANINGGNVGACFYAGKYFFNRWNATNVYFMTPTGTNGGPGGTPTAQTYQGSIRDMAISSVGSDRGYYIWGGAASSTLYKFGANAQTLGTYSVSGASFRAIAYDEGRDAFWNANFGGAITLKDTAGATLNTYANPYTGKYGMAYDDKSNPPNIYLWVWDQTPAQTIHKLDITALPPSSPVNYTFTGGASAGGAGAYPSPDGTEFWLVLCHQNFANVAYKLADISGPTNPGFPESFESTTFPPPGWGKFNVGGGTGWTRLTVGTTPIPGWTGGVITAPPGGQTAVAFCTWNTGGPIGNDQYLYTPQISGVNIADADSITYWLKRTYNDYADTVELRVSTTTPTAGGFTNLLRTHGYPASGGDTNWVRFAVSLAGFTGQNIYVAWREKVADNLNNGAAISLDLIDIAGTITGVTNNQTPGTYELNQNYPNPFNPTTTINFSIPKSGLVTIKVFDLLGKEVTTLVNDPKVAGTYSVNFDGTNLSSGVYFYKIEANDFVAVKRMMLIK